MLYKHILLGAAVAGAAVVSEACTSWVVHPSVSASGRMLVQKCRDSFVNPLDADVRRSRSGIKWMRIGMFKHGALFGVNEKGVAAIMNDGDDLTVKHPGKNIEDRLMENTAALIRQIVSDCSSAEQGVRIILHFANNNTMLGRGQTMFVADPKRAFMVDIGPGGYGQAKEIWGGLIIITNCLHLPGVEYISRKSVGGTCSDRAREANTRAELKKRRVKGKYTVKGTIETSRLRCQKPITRKYPCRRGSLGGCCFELDPEFPAQLTTAYIALGPQQHTIYLPTPMSIEQFPKEIFDSSWADLAYQLRKNVGFDHKYLARITAYEEKILPEYEAVREEARKLLKEGKKAEAIELLNDCYKRQYEGALKLMKELVAESAAEPVPENEQIKAEV